MFCEFWKDILNSAWCHLKIICIIRERWRWALRHESLKRLVEGSSDDFKTNFLFSREAQEGPTHTCTQPGEIHREMLLPNRQSVFVEWGKRERKRSTEKKLENAVGVCVNGGREQWNCVKESVRACLSFLSAQVFWFWPQRSSKASEDF